MPSIPLLSPLDLELMLRMLLSFVLGGVLGYERERTRQAAGCAPTCWFAPLGLLHRGRDLWLSGGRERPARPRPSRRPNCVRGRLSRCGHDLPHIVDSARPHDRRLDLAGGRTGMLIAPACTPWPYSQPSAPILPCSGADTRHSNDVGGSASRPWCVMMGRSQRTNWPGDAGDGDGVRGSQDPPSVCCPALIWKLGAGDHPLCVIRRLAIESLARLSSVFDQMIARPLTRPSRLLLLTQPARRCASAAGDRYTKRAVPHQRQTWSGGNAAHVLAGLDSRRRGCDGE